MNKIYLLLPVGRDIKLLPHWVRHYASFGFDRILVSVHRRPEWSPTIVEDVQSIVSEYGGIVADVHEGQVMNLQMRRERMVERFCEPDDWVFMADLDEFHQYPVSPRELVDHCRHSGYDYLTGRLLDRVGPGGNFPVVAEQPCIWDQFPVGCRLTEVISGGTAKKIALARASTPIVEGQHSAQGRGCPEEDTVINIHHFKWDDTVVDRMRYYVWQYSLEAQWYVMEGLRFLRHVRANGGRINLEDAKLEAFWPRFSRESPRHERQPEEVPSIVADPVFFVPNRSRDIQLSKVDNQAILAGGHIRITIDPLFEKIWNLCDGSRTTGDISDGLITETDARQNAMELSIQKGILELYKLGALSSGRGDRK